MFVILCLLLVIGLMLTGGLFAVCVMLNGVLSNQGQSIRTMRQISAELQGEASDGILVRMAYDLEKVSGLVKDAKQGRIPNMRYDDWYATKEDIERWEHAAIMEAATAR